MFQLENESDPEEAEFAQQLAEKLLSDNGDGKAHFDNEDPDMDGWSDIDDEEEGSDSGESDYPGVDEKASPMLKKSSVADVPPPSSSDDEIHGEDSMFRDMETSDDEDGKNFFSDGDGRRADSDEINDVPPCKKLKKGLKVSSNSEVFQDAEDFAKVIGEEKQRRQLGKEGKTVEQRKRK